MGLTLHLEKTTKVIMDLKDSLNLSTSVMYEHHGVEPGDRTIKLTKAEMADWNRSAYLYGKPSNTRPP